MPKILGFVIRVKISLINSAQIIGYDYRMKSLIIPLLLLLTSCLPEESKPTSSSLHVAAGDILVSSSVLDSVIQFDANGVYKRVLWRTMLATETVSGVGWMHSTNEILITVDGTPDRVVAVSVTDGSERTLINNVNITGALLRTATQLNDSRDIIITETASIERATESGVRETFVGVWPSTVTTNVQDLAPLEGGGFVTASSSTGVRVYPDSVAVFAASATVAAPVGTTGSFGVTEMPNGQFLISWEGAATDYLSIYNADLTLDTHVVNNQGLLGAPRGVAVKKNGNLLVADNTFDYVLEVTPAGTEVQRIGLGFLDAPYNVLVVPDFSP
jgi:hypothetical protein